MSRLRRPEVKSSNPASKFLEWKSNEKKFSYYDKGEKKQVFVELPLKFAFIEHYHTVKGFNDSEQSGVYSNEVYSIANEKMKVKTFSGVEISDGLYSENKTKIKAAGGNYYRSIYGVTPDGNLINISLKGSCIGGISNKKSLSKKECQGYSDFYNKNSNLISSKWVEIKGFSEGKSGTINYSIPNFEIGSELTKDEDEIVCKVADVFQEFVDLRASAPDSSENAPDSSENTDMNDTEIDF